MNNSDNNNPRRSLPTQIQTSLPSTVHVMWDAFWLSIEKKRATRQDRTFKREVTYKYERILTGEPRRLKNARLVLLEDFRGDLRERITTHYSRRDLIVGEIVPIEGRVRGIGSGTIRQKNVVVVTVY